MRELLKGRLREICTLVRTSHLSLVYERNGGFYGGHSVCPVCCFRVGPRVCRHTNSLKSKMGPWPDPPSAPSSALGGDEITDRPEVGATGACNSQTPHSALSRRWHLAGASNSSGRIMEVPRGSPPPGPEGAGFRNSFMHRPYRRVHAPNQMPELGSPVSPSVSASISPNCANLVLTGFSSAGPLPHSPSKNAWWLAWCIARFPLDADRGGFGSFGR